MKKILNFLKSHPKLSWGLLIAASLILSFLLALLLKKEKVSIPTPTGPSYKSITPGKSDKNELINKLGNPIKQSQTDDNLLTLDYASNSPNRNEKFILEDSKVALIKEIVTLKDIKTKQDITRVYGAADYILYGPDVAAGFYLYVYPDKGIAFIGKKESDLILEVWYFVPTSLSQFQSKLAKNYTFSPIKRQ